MKYYLERSVIFMVLLIFHSSDSAKGDCRIVVSNMDVKQPLILKPNAKAGYKAFHYPKYKDVITFTTKQEVDFACPGTRLSIKNSEVVRAKCSSEKFGIGSKSYTFRSIKCRSAPHHTARYTKRKCLKKYKEIEIGFVVDKKFFRQILICFDEQKQSTLYTQFTVSRTLKASHAEYERSSWTQGNFYIFEQNGLNKYYSKKSQRATINKLLGLHYSSQKYVSDKADKYIARGHLAAKADFLYGAQQQMTFYYINAAPQWQSFNAKNWLALERDVRKRASELYKDLVVYTGTHGVATLPHTKTGKEIELFLYVNGSKKYIPVPRLFWKVIYEPKSENGVAFLGVNNPYYLKKSKDIICKSICHKVDWLTWKAETVENGYSYCCNLTDIRKIMYIPDIATKMFSASKYPIVTAFWYLLPLYILR